MSMRRHEPNRSRTLVSVCAGAAVASLIVLVVAVANAAPAAAASAAGACSGTSGVTVVVDARNAGGGISVRCALGPQASGWKALENAGHALTSPPRYPGTAVCQIDGLPHAGYPTCWESNVWWYSHASNPNGAGWTESGIGAATYAPAPGSVEGWKYRGISDPDKFPPLGPGFGAAAPPVAPPQTAPPATKPLAPGGGAGGGSTGPKPVAPGGGAPAATTPPAATPTTASANGAAATTTIPGLVAPADATTTSRARDQTTTSSDKRALAGLDLSSTKDDGGIPIGTIVGAIVVLALAASAAFVAYRRARAA